MTFAKHRYSINLVEYVNDNEVPAQAVRALMVIGLREETRILSSYTGAKQLGSV